MAVPALTRPLAAEGVGASPSAPTTPSVTTGGTRLRPGRRRVGRDASSRPSRSCATIPGVTVLIYDQQCAAEARRLRKRGERRAAPAGRHQPGRLRGVRRLRAEEQLPVGAAVETEFGRKTRIHQSSCNLDFTCLDGDCPSFVTVHETRRSRRRRQARQAAALVRDVPVIRADDVVEPDRPAVDGCFSTYLTGVGGTGVVTMSQVLATAALLDGYEVSGLDQTGLSQKGGPVVSHVKMTSAPIVVSNTIGAGGADVYLGFDLLVAADPRHLASVRPGTQVVVSTSKVPTGAMVRDTSVGFPAVDGLLRAIADRSGGIDADVDVHAIAEGLFADHMMANPFLIGVAYQRGALPRAARRSSVHSR